MGFLDRIFGRRPSALLDSVTFEASRYAYQGERDGAKVWFTPHGDAVGLYFFPRPSDLPRNAASIEQLRAYYASVMGSTKLRVIDCRVQPLDGVNGVWFVSGGTDEFAVAAVYVGSLTIPFRDFSYVIKIQGQEQGVTGLREALLVAEALRDGTGSMEDASFVPHGWSPDDEQFDRKVPQHPLSRVRRELRLIAASVRIELKVKAAARFELPQGPE